MAEKKTSFVLPTDCVEDLEDFTDSEAGELFRAILTYANTQEETDFSDRAMKMYFKRIKKYIDSANENYEKIKQARSEAGAKGGRIKKDDDKKQKEANESKKSNCFFEKANGSKEKQMKAKQADTDTESDTDTDTESVLKESVREKTPSPTKTYGENGNVKLTEDEFERLAEQMGVSKRNEYIEKLGDYMLSTGKRYQSHYATIRNWFRRDGGKKDSDTSPSFDIEEFNARAEQLPEYRGGVR